MTAYNSLADRPLDATDDFYVDYLERSGSDPIADLSNAIEFATTESVHLMSGQRGNGKSTALRRLKRDLEDGQDAQVYLCDMSHYIYLAAPLDISVFLMSLMGAWSDAIHERHGVYPTQESYWERAVKFLRSEVNFGELKIATGAGVTLGAVLKQDATIRQRIEEQMRGHIAQLVRDVHQYVADTVAALRKRTGKADQRIVLIADSLEQIRGGVLHNADDVYKSVAALFAGGAEWLKLPGLHVVYTIPPYLPALSSNLGATFGSRTVYNIPTIHVRRRKTGTVEAEEDGASIAIIRKIIRTLVTFAGRKADTVAVEEDGAGIAIVREILAKRISDLDGLFAADAIDEAILASGGDFRDLFRLLQLVILRLAASETWPADQRLFEEVKNEIRRDMVLIAMDDAAWLDQIHRTKKPALPSIDRLPRLARFFDNKLVLNYRNGDDWYDVHPLIQAELPAMLQASDEAGLKASDDD